MTTLSKSKLLAYRQCEKRLWLEVHRPQERQESAGQQRSFQVGHSVGEVARKIYGQDESCAYLNLDQLGFDELFDKTRRLLGERATIFEAGFRIGGSRVGALALADIVRPLAGSRGWEMIEVKSSTSVKDYHRDDVSIQYYIASRAGLNVQRVALAYIDSSWTYAVPEVFSGLLKEEDLTELACSRGTDVARWLDDAHRVVASPEPPAKRTGSHCSSPFECGFAGYCSEQEASQLGTPQHPVQWIPGRYSNALNELLTSNCAPRDMRDVPDEVLYERQRLVKRQHLEGGAFFDSVGAASALSTHGLPALFLDFETVSFPVPIWLGTRPYEQIPFQFSVHRLDADGSLCHFNFLDLSGEDPSERIAEALLNSCGSCEPIYAYNSSFEGGRLQWLADRLPQCALRLLAIKTRLVDLRLIAQSCFYHPLQKGSWSLKSLLPAIAPDLSYVELSEVEDGGQAVDAYLESIAPGTSNRRREEIRIGLTAYCRLDTFAMVRMWATFAGKAQFTQLQDRCLTVELAPF